MTTFTYNDKTKLSAALSALAPYASGNSRPAVRIAAIVASLEAGDLVAALNEIRSFGDAAERNGVALRIKPLLALLCDAYALASVADNERRWCGGATADDATMQAIAAAE